MHAGLRKCERTYAPTHTYARTRTLIRAHAHTHACAHMDTHARVRANHPTDRPTACPHTARLEADRTAVVLWEVH